MKYLFLALIFISTISIAQQTIPENISENDIQNVNVDDISDQQLLDFYRQAQRKGLSEQQVMSLLEARGMSRTKIMQLRNRLEQLQNMPSQQGSVTGIRDDEPIPSDEKLLEMLTIDSEEYRVSKIQEKIFGYDLFSTKQLSFTPSVNLPTPENYQLGPGDELIIDIWGASEVTYQLVVTPDGYIRISNLGPVYVSGMNIKEAESRIINRLSKIYSGLRGQNPNTFAMVSLGNARSIKINVVGEVNTPGTYTVNSFSTVFNALYLSGGPNINGSLRNIKLVRGDQTVETIDVYNFLMDGKIGESNLKDNDIVLVPSYETRVEITGAIKRPGIYEMRENETFDDLIKFAGGFTDLAYKERIYVERKQDFQKEIISLDNNLNTLKPRNGDFVVVEEIVDKYSNRVIITGGVYMEGPFELEENMSLTDLIEKAGGLREDARTDKILIYRKAVDQTLTLLSTSLDEASDDPFILEAEDKIRIPSKFNLEDELTVSIEGAVRLPGFYPFMENMELSELILLAGGLKEDARGAIIEVARRDISIDDQYANSIIIEIDEGLGIKEDLALKSYDVVYVKKSSKSFEQKSVTIIGEVLYPGKYAITAKNSRISDIIKRAGGLTNDAYPQGATLIRRTEFYQRKSDEERQKEEYEDLLRYQQNYTIAELIYLNETEKLQQQRLEQIKEQQKQNRKAENKQNDLSEAEQQNIEEKRAMLEELQEKDTTINAEIKTTERIGIELTKILENPGSNFDLYVEDGDILNIPVQLQTVRMRGEFLYPVTARYEKGRRFKYYLDKAGGSTESARKSKVYVIYPNGSVARTRSFLGIKSYPKIEPGSEIVMPEKPEKQGLTIPEMSLIASSLATVATVVVTIANATR